MEIIMGIIIVGALVVFGWLAHHRPYETITEIVLGILFILFMFWIADLLGWL